MEILVGSYPAAERRLQHGRFARTASGLRSFARKQPIGTLAAIVILALVVIAIDPSRFAPKSYDRGVQRAALQAPSGQNWFGTDQLGRDVFSRLVYGAQTSVVIGFTTVVLSVFFASTIAILSASIGGWTDFLIQRVADIWQTFPPLVFTILIISVLGQSTTTVIVALSLVTFASQQRVVRSAALSARSALYVEAAQVIGASQCRIMLRYILPNVLPIIIVVASTAVGSIILAESALSFLGFGPPPPFPSWGRMLNDAQGYLRIAKYLVVFPAVAIAATVYACNMFGDAIRDHLDPRLR